MVGCLLKKSGDVNVQKWMKTVRMMLAVLLLVALLPLGSREVNASSNGFSVNGTTVYDANGSPFVMRGVNVAHAWYQGETETSIKGIAARGANTVRIVCSDGSQYTKTSKAELERIVQLCKENQVVAVLEVHDATGSDDVTALNRAANYWKEMKTVLQGNEAYVIVNIANEWGGAWDGAAWANGYKQVLPELRSSGINNLLMVDCAGWGQYPDSIKDYGREVIAADPNRNLMFSIHMYEYAGGDATTVKNNIDNALATGVPLTIGEFGFKHTDGDVDEYTIMQYSQEKGVGYLGWSWKGNGDTWAYLDLATSFDGSNLSDWGNTLFYGDYGIGNTSKTCTVFTGSQGDNGNESGNNDQENVVTNLEGEYYLKSAYSNKYLDVAAASAANGANVQQYDFNGGNAQKFKLEADGQGFYTIYTASSNYQSCLDVSHGSADNGANIQQWSAYGGDAQKFQFVKNGDKFIIKTKASNCYASLDVYDWSKDNGGNIAQWEYLGGENQHWYLEQVTGNGESGEGNQETPGELEENSLFYGNSTASNWNQAVSVKTSKNGGSFDGGKVVSGGSFYVEYDGGEGQIELVLQSWSGASDWAKVNPSEAGYANGHRYLKFSYDNCVAAFGTSDFANKLDVVHASAKDSQVTVYSLSYGN